MPRTCFCPGCKTGFRSTIKILKREGKKVPSLFSPPKDPYIFEMWKRAIPRADKTLRLKDYVCELHFRKEDIECYFETKLFNGNIHRFLRGKKMLKPGVVPCIFPNVPGHSSFVGDKTTYLKKKFAKYKKISFSSNMKKESKKPRISCPDNKTNRKNDSSLQTEKENVLMEVIVVHPIPEKSSTTRPSFLKEKRNAEKAANSSVSYTQKQVMPEPETAISTLVPAPSLIIESHPKQSICNKILTESSICDNLTKNHFEQNSTVTTITESPVPFTLTENYSKQTSSIRTITESSMLNALTEKYSDQSVCDITLTESPTNDSPPDDYSEQSNGDETLNEFSSATLTESNVNQSICDKIVAESNNVSSQPVMEEHVSFDFLKSNINMFETTNSWWRVNTFDDFIVFSRWTSDYTIERRIVITKDLVVKVFLIDTETTIGRDFKKFSIYDITKLIYRVENLKICSGIDKKDRNCTGFLQSVFMCKRYNLCLNCIKWRKEERKKTVKQLKESANVIELLNFNLIT